MTEVAEYLIDGSKKCIARSSFDFRVRVSLKGAVKIVSDCQSFLLQSDRLILVKTIEQLVRT